jgi:hypothetical protein
MKGSIPAAAQMLPARPTATGLWRKKVNLSIQNVFHARPPSVEAYAPSSPGLRSIFRTSWLRISVSDFHRLVVDQLAKGGVSESSPPLQISSPYSMTGMGHGR